MYEIFVCFAVQYSITGKLVCHNSRVFLADIIKRDANDRGRAIAPAIPAPDAIFVDNSEMTPEETLAHSINIIKTKLGIEL
mgnify:FL=1